MGQRHSKSQFTILRTYKSNQRFLIGLPSCFFHAHADMIMMGEALLSISLAYSYYVQIIVHTSNLLGLLDM